MLQLSQQIELFKYFPQLAISMYHSKDALPFLVELMDLLNKKSSST